jgi:adenylosuccinate lyase
LVFSQPVLLALVQSGLSRDEAYRIVQDNAMRAWDERCSFRGLLEKDERVTVDQTMLDQAFDVRRSLRHVDRVFAALDELD